MCAMPPDQQKVRELFVHAVFELPPEEWDDYVGRACGEDAELEQRVRQLLRAHREAGSFLDHPAVALGATGAFSPLPDEAAAAPLRERSGTVIGPYKLLEQIGEGGFGLVFLAEQHQPLHRKVAIKVIKPGMHSKQVIARFEAERQALALMDHSNIAKVLDAGETDDGRPYFAMELVRGVPVTEYCDQQRLTTRARLELFASVCHAVFHAHQKGIIHRDIKPSNVLVTLLDGVPVVKVIDFGIAKALGHALTDKTLCTGHAQLVGTPLYMSPEQAELSGLNIDTRSDIYSLGVLLYELLTGVTPFDKQRLREVGYDEMRRIIREEEPSKPSTRLSTLGQVGATVSERRQSDPKRLSQLLRGELDWIVMKALEKDRNRRYETASAFAADVGRYLNDEPVAACPPSVRYRVRKFARRNKRGLATTGLVVTLLMSAGIGTGWVMRERAERQAKAGTEQELALERGELFQKEGKPVEAQAALERAQFLAAEAPFNPERNDRLAALKDRLAEDARNAAFIARFEEYRLLVRSQVNVLKNEFTYARFATEVEKALREYGIAIGEMPPADAAALVQNRSEPVRHNLIVALEECLWWGTDNDLPKRVWLLDTLAASDKDPWRILVRKSALDHDRTALEKLVQTADIEKQPPTTLLFAANTLPAKDRLVLMRRIQRAHPADLWANHDLALALLFSGRPAEAIGYFTAALALQPDNPGIYNNRGSAYRNSGEFDEAIADCRQSIKLAPLYSAAHYNLGLALREKKQLRESIVAFTEAIRHNSRFAEAWFQRGLTRADLNEWNEAIADYSQAIALDPKIAETWNNRGLVHTQLKQWDKAIADYSQAITQDPQYALAWNNRGWVHAQLKEWDKAIADYTQAIKLDTQSVKAWNNRGIAYSELKKWDLAIADFTQGVQLDAKSADVWYYRGNAYSEVRQWDKAIADYSMAISIDNRFVLSYYNRGNTYFKLKQWDKAIADYSQAIALDTQYAMAWNNRGIAYSELKKWDLAIADYSQAIALDAKLLVAWQNRCTVHLKLEQWEDAIVDLSRAVELDSKRDPRNAAMCNELAWSLATHPNPKVRDPRRAIKWALKAVELVPGEGNYWNTLGVAHYRAGDWNAAREALEQSMGLRKGGDSSDWFFLAMSHEKLGNKEKARQWYDKAVEWMDKKDPENAELRGFRVEAAEILGIKGETTIDPKDPKKN
jgi:eukaryotic-like serine/threonine-protein kinase